MVISIKGVSKSFGKIKVIDDINLEIESGSFTTLLGSSGSGKTTLLRIIAGLETPDAGEIWLGDRCVYSSAKKINIPPEKRGIGVVFQDFALWPHMTVYDNIAFALKIKGAKDIKERVEKALASVSLTGFEDRYPESLSGGQQQRVAFARALAYESDIILFDEPLSALDALLREKMRLELREIVAKLKLTAVFVTHDQSEAMSMSTRIALLNKGKIEQYATPEDIYSHPASKFVATFIGQSDWVDSTTMIRPEKLSKISSDMAFTVSVENSIFLGNTYQVYLRYKDKQWVYYSDSFEKAEESFSLYASNKDLIKFKEE